MAAAAEVTPEVGTAAVCRAVGVPRATVYRWRRPPTARTRRERPTPARALGPSERQAVLDVLHSERFCDRSPLEVHATLLEEGRYLCAPRTMYRILASTDEVRERRNQLRHPHYARPELVATRPNEVWSWDITKLKGPAKWVYYYLYVVLDIFSRYVVGWLLAQHENAGLAQRLIRDTCTRQGVEPGQLILHADRGAPMTSKTVAQLLADLGVEKTHARPHVSDDNPFSESQFKTLKYSPGFPDRFGSPEHARDVSRMLFRWYNHEHHHGALRHLTPAVVHYGRADLVLAERHRVQLAAYHHHPERFVNGPPSLQRLSEAVWINPPETARRQDAPGSTQTDPDDLRVVPSISTYEPLTRSGARRLLSKCDRHLSQNR
jgi:putative transposase